MKFRYKQYGSRVSRPVIPITIKHGNKSIRYEALVDSGADECFFHSEVGELLGLDIKKGKAEEVFGIGGKVLLYYRHKILIEVGGSSHEIEAGFLPDVAGRVMKYGVLGQKGFFDLFIVRFDFPKGEIELKKIKK